MDDDLKRWRKLGTDPLYREPLSNGAVFVQKKPHQRRPIQPIHHPHKHPSQLSLPAFGHGSRLKQDKVFVQDILERISKDQKQAIDVLWSGHLNHNNINKVLETSPYKKRGFAPAPPSPSPPSIANEYVLQTPPLPSPDPTPRAATSLASIDHIDAPENMHEVLKQFDSVRINDSSIQENDSLQEPNGADGLEQGATNIRVKQAAGPAGLYEIIDKNDLAYQRKYMPAYQLNLTKHGQYRSWKAADNGLVQSLWTRKQESSKQQGLNDLAKFIQTELEVLGLADTTAPDLKKLQIYRHVFDEIIGEFKQYGPILAEIKTEYDKFIDSYNSDQNELVFLRGKVRKLLAQNENRLLLKFERKKSLQMETLIARLKHENEFLNSEMRRKLTLYASYLTLNQMIERKREDPLLGELERDIQRFEKGEDPITVYERQIKNLTEEGENKSAEIASLKKAQVEEFVPKTIHDKLDTEHTEVSAKFATLSEEHAQLEEDLKSKIATVAKLEAALKEKEEQYHFLIAEYTGLTETLAKKGG